MTHVHARRYLSFALWAAVLVAPSVPIAAGLLAGGANAGGSAARRGARTDGSCSAPTAAAVPWPWAIPSWRRTR
jgi:hypothetical protein